MSLQNKQHTYTYGELLQRMNQLLIFIDKNIDKPLNEILQAEFAIVFMSFSDSLEGYLKESKLNRLQIEAQLNEDRMKFDLKREDEIQDWFCDRLNETLGKASSLAYSN